jgi:hypothetical protein
MVDRLSRSRTGHPRVRPQRGHGIPTWRPGWFSLMHDSGMSDVDRPLWRLAVALIDAVSAGELLGVPSRGCSRRHGATVSRTSDWDAMCGSTLPSSKRGGAAVCVDRVEPVQSADRECRDSGMLIGLQGMAALATPWAFSWALSERISRHIRTSQRRPHGSTDRRTGRVPPSSPVSPIAGFGSNAPVLACYPRGLVTNW